MKAANRDICHSQHQRAFRKAALRPRIFPGKRISFVSFPVSICILEQIFLPIYLYPSTYQMPHTPHTMPAFQERKYRKRSHNVIFQRKKGAKPQFSAYIQLRRMYCQKNPPLSKPTLSNPDILACPVKCRSRIINIPRMILRNNLDGTRFLLPLPVNRRDNRQGLCFRLAFKIPAIKIIAHIFCPP